MKEKGYNVKRIATNNFHCFEKPLTGAPLRAGGSADGKSRFSSPFLHIAAGGYFMKIRKILLVCLSALFAAAGCSAYSGEKAGGADDSAAPVSGPVIHVDGKTANTEMGGEVLDLKNSAAVEYYGTNTNASAYQINGDYYMSLDDLSALFRTKFTYHKDANTVSIGDATRANADFYMPDVSGYPNLDRVIELPPYEVWTDGGVVDFKFLTKRVPFRDMMPKIDKALYADGFTVALREEYAQLTKAKSEFQQGERKNTYIKYKSGNTELTPYVIQIIDGGLNQDKLPVIVVRMAGG
jgi:hypothetical protein